MTLDNRKAAGTMLFVGVVQVILLQVICQTVYLNYNVGQQAISDLGNWDLAGQFAVVFNISVILLGLFIVAGAYLLRREAGSRIFVSLLALGGTCNIGIGIFAEEIAPAIHGLLYLVMSVAWIATAIYMYKLGKSPFSYVSVGLGAVSLAAFVIGCLGKYVFLSYIISFGGLERLSVYPLWLWTLGYGAYLMAANSAASSINNKKPEN